MKTSKEQRNEMRIGLVCLVPINKSAGGISCHEKTICDCRVIELLDDLDTQESELTKLRKRVEVLSEALKFYAKGGNFNLDLWKHEELGYFTGKRAKEALAESAKIAESKE